MCAGNVSIQVSQEQLGWWVLYILHKIGRRRRRNNLPSNVGSVPDLTIHVAIDIPIDVTMHVTKSIYLKEGQHMPVVITLKILGNLLDL